MKEYSIIGKRIPLRDAPEKVTGKAQFTVDVKLPGLLHAKLLRSPYAHAKVLKVDTSEAERVPGIKAVLSKNNSPLTKVPVIFDIPSDKVLFDEKVRYSGDAVAAVAAISEEIAENALKLIKVDYEILPAVFDPEEAIKKGAPLIHAEKEKNIAGSFELSSGDVETGFLEADYIIENKFRTSSQRHACMETHSAIASFDQSGKLTVWTSTQVPFLVQRALAEYLDMPISKVRVIRPHVGGAFGSKLEMLVEHICALLSKTTNRPVRLVLTREEEFTSTVSRHEYLMTLKVGAKKDGSLSAIQAYIISNEGAYLHKTGPLGVACRGITGTYRCPNIKFEGLRVYTNMMSAGAYRAYGNPQGHFAIESMIDEIAEKVGIDPVEFRLNNYKQAGDIGLASIPIAVSGITECLSRGKDLIGWPGENTSISQAGSKKRGKGMACFTHATGTLGYIPDYSTATIQINGDGTIQLFIGNADIGTGSTTALAQIAAEELGVNLEAIDVITGDTNTPSYDCGAFASKTLYNIGNAVKAAINDVTSKILFSAAKKLNAGSEDLEFKNGRIYIKQAPEKCVLYSELIKSGVRGLRDNCVFLGQATFENKVFPLSFGVNFAEVEVDTETGQVEVLKIAIVQDQGTVINPMIVEGQIEGAIQHGIGYALTENVIINKQTGIMLNPNFANYMLFTALDMPQVRVGFAEPYEPSGPFGAKGMGELPLIGIAPAIVNAIYNAIGIRFTELPVTPEKIFYALHTK